VQLVAYVTEGSRLGRAGTRTEALANEVMRIDEGTRPLLDVEGGSSAAHGRRWG
jgi:hypothetical protein